MDKKECVPKVNLTIPRELLESVIAFCEENEMTFSGCVRKSERLYGAYVLENNLIKEMEGDIVKQVKFKVSEHQRIKESTASNHVWMTNYLKTCLVLMVYEGKAWCKQ